MISRGTIFEFLLLNLYLRFSPSITTPMAEESLRLRHRRWSEEPVVRLNDFLLFLSMITSYEDVLYGSDVPNEQRLFSPYISKCPTRTDILSSISSLERCAHCLVRIFDSSIFIFTEVDSTVYDDFNNQEWKRKLWFLQGHVPFIEILRRIQPKSQGDSLLSKFKIDRFEQKPILYINRPETKLLGRKTSWRFQNHYGRRKRRDLDSTVLDIKVPVSFTYLLFWISKPVMTGSSTLDRSSLHSPSFPL